MLPKAVYVPNPSEFVSEESPLNGNRFSGYARHAIPIYIFGILCMICALAALSISIYCVVMIEELQDNQESTNVHITNINVQIAELHRTVQLNADNFQEFSTTVTQALADIQTALTALNSTTVQLDSRVSNNEATFNTTSETFFGELSALNDTINGYRAAVLEEVNETQAQLSKVKNETLVTLDEALARYDETIAFMQAGLYDLGVPCTLECANFGTPSANCSVCTGCAHGWGGPLCSDPINACLLVCNHGGFPNNNCTSCVCPPLYTGVDCSEWANLPPDEVVALLSVIYNNITVASNSTKRDVSPPCANQLNLAVGYGTNARGELLYEPIVDLIFDEGNVIYDAYGYPHCVPDNAITSIGNGAGGKIPHQESALLLNGNIKPWTEDHFSEGKQTVKLFGVPNNPQEYTDKYLDKLLHVYRSTFELLRVSLSETSSQKLTPGFLAMLSLMPAHYSADDPSSQAAWFYFLELFGINTITSAGLGALVEVQSYAKACALAYQDAAQMQYELTQEVEQMLGVSEPSFIQGTASINGRVLNIVCNSVGGNPLLNPTQTDYENWKNSLGTNLAPVNWQVRSTLDYIPGFKKAAATAALADYVNQELELLKEFDSSVSSIIQQEIHQPAILLLNLIGAQAYDAGDAVDDEDFDFNRYTQNVFGSSMTLLPGEIANATLSTGENAIGCAVQVACERDPTGQKIRASIQLKSVECTDYANNSKWFGSSIFYGDWAPITGCATAGFPGSLYGQTTGYHPETWIDAAVRCCGCAGVISNAVTGTTECTC